MVKVTSRCGEIGAALHKTKSEGDEFVGFREVGDAHIRAVPFELAFEARGEGAELHDLSERSGDGEIGTGRIAAFAGANPVLIMAG